MSKQYFTMCKYVHLFILTPTLTYSVVESVAKTLQAGPVVVLKGFYDVGATISCHADESFLRKSPGAKSVF